MPKLPTLGSERDALILIERARNGIAFAEFDELAGTTPFSRQEWSTYLGISERTMQRYREEDKRFDRLQSEKILEISAVLAKGLEVFGDDGAFHQWLESPSVALGGILPKSILDTSFGVQLIEDELTRIEHGILA